MSPQYTVVIDTDHLADVAKADRTWLETWLHVSKRTREKNLVTVPCASRLETLRVTIMLTNRGLPKDAISTRRAA